MAVIRISRKHDLDRDTIRAEVQDLAEQLARKLSATYRWQGDQLQFERSGASGKIDIGADDLKIEMKLGLLLTPLKPTIESTIEEYLAERLG